MRAKLVNENLNENIIIINYSYIGWESLSSKSYRMSLNMIKDIITNLDSNCTTKIIRNKEDFGSGEIIIKNTNLNKEEIIKNFEIYEEPGYDFHLTDEYEFE